MKENYSEIKENGIFQGLRNYYFFDPLLKEFLDLMKSNLTKTHLNRENIKLKKIKLLKSRV